MESQIWLSNYILDTFTDLKDDIFMNKYTLLFCIPHDSKTNQSLISDFSNNKIFSLAHFEVWNYLSS